MIAKIVVGLDNEVVVEAPEPRIALLSDRPAEWYRRTPIEWICWNTRDAYDKWFSGDSDGPRQLLDRAVGS
jgi:hypothetical protein